MKRTRETGDTDEANSISKMARSLHQVKVQEMVQKGLQEILVQEKDGVEDLRFSEGKKKEEEFLSFPGLCLKRTVSDPPTHDSSIYSFIDYIFIQCSLHVRYCFGTQDVAINQSNKVLVLKELIFYGGRQTVNKHIGSNKHSGSKY